jgi:hypothetical protein
MDFIRSTSEKMNIWPVEHFFPPFFSRSAKNQHWSGKKRGKKVFNWSEVHFSGRTSYEIHILVAYSWEKNFIEKIKNKSEPKFSKSNIKHCVDAMQAHVCTNGPCRGVTKHATIQNAKFSSTCWHYFPEIKSHHSTALPP